MYQKLPKKLYVQYMPDKQAQATLLKLQADLQNQVTTGQLVPIDELHVTVLHFGFLTETFKQLQTINPALQESAYNEVVDDFINALEPVLPVKCELTINQLAHFGPGGGVLALALKEDLGFIKAHEESMKYLRRLARTLDVGAIADIPPRPRALQVPTNPTPHVSLLKAVRDKHVSDPGKDLTGKKLTFTLFPLR